jgi:hypothetical protein
MISIAENNYITAAQIVGKRDIRIHTNHGHIYAVESDEEDLLAWIICCLAKEGFCPLNRKKGVTIKRIWL